MSLRLETLQVARLAPKLLPDAVDLVVAFLKDQTSERGGFKNRAGEPDLYYTVFGLEGLTALRAGLPTEAIAAFLRGFGDGESLDLVHLASLARCWANLPGSLDEQRRARMLERLNAFAPGRDVYSCFLAAGAYQDLGSAPPDPETVLATVASLQAEDGGFSNQPDARAGSTPATAAAVTLTRYLGGAPSPAASRWLLARCHHDGGFFASPTAPIPDLLSTATALHALVGVHESIEAIKEPCLDFLDSLWTARGGFHGTWADEVLDCEYTYYGLLALGHLSL